MKLPSRWLVARGKGSRVCYLLSVQLGQVAESNGEGLCVVLLDPEVDWLQTAHVEKQLGLLQSHGAAEDTRRHVFTYFSVQSPKRAEEIQLSETLIHT